MDSDRDMRILADSFRAVNEVAAWDAMLLAWNRKIVGQQYPGPDFAGADRLRGHYAELLGVLRQMIEAPTQSPADRVVESVAAAAMVIDSQRRVVVINAAGRTSFGLEQGQFSGDHWIDREHRAAWHELTGNPRGNTGQAVFRICLPDDRQGLAEAFALDAPTQGGRLVAVRQLDHPWSDNVARVLDQAFGLTAAEIAVCELLLESGSIRNVATRRGVSERTVRIQASAIFRKTETSGQVELVRLLSLLAARLAPAPPERQLRWNDPTGRVATIVRPDGRRLSHDWIGDPDGAPALHLPFVAGGTLFPPAFEAALKARGIRLILLHRPGTGYSDHDPAAAPVADHVAAIRDLCGALSLPPVVAFAHHAAAIPLAALAGDAGGPLAAAVAMGRFTAYVPERIGRVHALAGTLVWLAVNAPWAIEVVGHLAQRALEQVGPNWYLDRVFAGLPADLATAYSAECAALLRNGVSFNFHQGHAAFFDDLRMRDSDFHGFLRGVRLPFHWWVGAVPPAKVNGSDFYFDREEQAAIAALNPAIDFETIPGTSELFFYQQPEAMAARIADTVDRYR